MTGSLPVVGDGDVGGGRIIGVLKESGDPTGPLLALWRQQRTHVGMNRASRGSGACQRRRQSLGKPGLACAQTCG